jgi:polyhydroxyalkanoate synthesis regulator phasin
MAAAKKGTTAKSSRPRKKPARNPAAGNKSVEEFRDALEKSVTLSRERLQEVMDDAVKRGRMTRADANKTVSNLVTKSRQQTDELLAELENLLDRARKDVEARVAPARKRAEKAVSAAARRARTTAEPALVEADKLRRRAGVASSAPITGYDNLNASQVKSRLKDMNKADLRKVRTQERRGKARKGILDDIEKRLAA